MKWLLLFLFFALPVLAAPQPDNMAEGEALRAMIVRAPGLFQIQGQNFKFDSSGNLQINCITGCSAASGFSDNSAFTVGTSTINVVGAYYTSGAAPTLSSGNAARVRMDSNSYLYTDCVVGCSGGSTTPTDAFANPTTAGMSMTFNAGYNGTTWDLLRSGDKNNVAGIVGVLNTGPLGRYNATQPTLTDTRYNMLQLSSRGELLVSPGTSGFTVAFGSAQHVIVDSGAVNATLQTSAGTDIGKLDANQSVNVAQINGITPLMGNGVTGTGSQRVTIASDNTAFAVNATLSAETTKVIGEVNQGTSPWVSSCTVANCSFNIGDWAGSVLGTPTNFGTTPGAVIAGSVNSSDFIGTVAAVAGNGVTTTGTQRVTLSSDSTGQVTLASGASVIATQGTGTNLHMVCDSGCSSSAGFADNSAFTVGTTAINPIGGLYDTGADPTITNGSAARARIDSHSYLLTDLATPIPAGTNVIGHVIADTGSTTAVTGVVEVAPTTAANTLSNQFFTQLSDGTHGNTFMSTTTSSKYGADVNLLSILGTAPTTAGFLDVKGADGNVFVRQTTGTNLHVVTDSTSTTAVTQATASNLNAAVVGTKTNNNAAPGATNVGSLGCIANAAVPSNTEGDQTLCSQDLSGNERVITGATAVTSNATLTSYTAATASTNATNVKNAAGNIYSITATNTTTTVYYLRLYNLSAAPTCSSATGFVETIPVGGASAGSMGGLVRTIEAGQGFGTGIGFCITGGAGSTDNTNAAVGVFVTVLYK